MTAFDPDPPFMPDPATTLHLGGCRCARDGIALPDGDFRAEGGQTRRDAATDACTATGHDGNTIGEEYVSGSYGHDPNVRGTLRILQELLDL